MEGQIAEIGPFFSPHGLEHKMLRHVDVCVDIRHFKISNKFNGFVVIS